MVAGERRGAVLAAIEHRAQLAPERDPEVERGADTSAVSGRQWPALSPAKNTPSSVAGPNAVRDPVALVAVRLGIDVLQQPQVGCLTGSCGSKEPTPMRNSSRAGNDQP